MSALLTCVYPDCETKTESILLALPMCGEHRDIARRHCMKALTGYLAEAEASRQEAKLRRRRAVTTITERRAEFVYDCARLAATAAQAPIVPVMWAWREEAFRQQFLEVIERQCGPHRSTSPEELHGSWMQAYYSMGWVYGEEYDREKRLHPDLVPYAQLGQLEKDKDAVFVALCEIARLYIYDGEAE